MSVCRLLASLGGFEAEPSADRLERRVAQRQKVKSHQTAAEGPGGILYCC